MKIIMDTKGLIHHNLMEIKQKAQESCISMSWTWKNKLFDALMVICVSFAKEILLVWQYRIFLLYGN